MKILNIHRRVINQSIDNISSLLETLATRDDKMLATNKWPAMRLDQGLLVGSKGGHGPIRYTVVDYVPSQSIKFKFSKPKGFNGFHKFEFIVLEDKRTEIKHTIEMDTVGIGILTWVFAVRWLHDAFIEDSFDKIENLYLAEPKTSQWSLWVRILRRVLR